ncbi:MULTISPECIES: hypothetical protein [Nocardia]|nr:hypothetical protein [Nocardia abscessus]
MTSPNAEHSRSANTYDMLGGMPYPKEQKCRADGIVRLSQRQLE